MIGPALLMFSYNPPNSLRSQSLPGENATSFQPFKRQLPEGTAKPAGERHRETLFAPIQYSLRQPRADDLLEQVLAGGSGQLEGYRHGSHIIHKGVIQERDSHFH